MNPQPAPDAASDRPCGSPGGIGPPSRVDLPLFTYGLLKPAGLAYDAIVGAGVDHEVAVLWGATLRIRDGLPILDDSVERRWVKGALLRIESNHDAYRRIGEFEPPKQYLWAERVVATTDGREVVANVLFGRKPEQGTAGDELDCWDPSNDNVLTFGLDVATKMLDEVAQEPFPVLPGESARLWDRFFRLSAAYLLLWSVVERYTALRFGPAEEPHPRVQLLDQSPEFQSAVRRLGRARQRPVVDSRNPARKYSIDEDGSGAAQYWYAVRSNLSHRGKSAFQDGQLLQQCARDLCAVITDVVQSSLGTTRATGGD